MSLAEYTKSRLVSGTGIGAAGVSAAGADAAEGVIVSPIRLFQH